jgi:hypothetical protein
MLLRSINIQFFLLFVHSSVLDLALALKVLS